MAALSPKERSSALNDLTQDELEALMEACTAHEKAAIIAAMTPEARCSEMSKLEVWEQDADPQPLRYLYKFVSNCGNLDLAELRISIISKASRIQYEHTTSHVLPDH